LPIKENPIRKLKLKAPDRRRERRLNEGDLTRLLEAGKATKNPFILPIIEFAIETGMRRGEILAMRWDHIQEAHRALLVPLSKNGQPRVLPLSLAALRLLERVRRTSERVFPISSNAFRLAWERLRRRAGLRDLNFHDLRHEAISRFFEKGLSVPEAALVSGHNDMRMLFRYTHAVRIRIIEKLDSPTTAEG
jgi:integrase